MRSLKTYPPFLKREKWITTLCGVHMLKFSICENTILNVIISNVIICISIPSILNITFQGDKIKSNYYFFNYEVLNFKS